MKVLAFCFLVAAVCGCIAFISLQSFQTVAKDIRYEAQSLEATQREQQAPAY